jgi:predicted amidohydrolase YtcJ
VVDLGGRRAVPGLIDSHTHIIRGGLNYNLELRWDGVRSLSDAMTMLRRQAQVTPPGQWLRVVGGFTEHQFAEKRLPTLDELNAAAPDTPVFVLRLYDRALLNRAALRVVGYDRSTPDPPGGEIQRDGDGDPTGLLLAKPNALILYATLAKGPKLPPDQQLNSTRHFMREMNRLGVTGVIDAGGGFQNYPDDYEIIQKLHADGELTLRIAYNLFTQKKGEEVSDFTRWGRMVRPGQGSDAFRHNGAGEMLVFSAADFEDFREPRPEMPTSMEGQLEGVVRKLVENRWPWRLHATYDETIGRALDVFERVNRDRPFGGLHWFFDHAETVSDRNIDRIAALGGGIAVQHRMAFQGEYFVDRYGAQAAERTPPVRRMLEPACRWERARTPRGWPPTTRGPRSPGWSPAGPSAACASTRSATGWTGRRRCASGPRATPGSPPKRARRGGSRSASWPTWRCSPLITSTCRRTRSRTSNPS